MAQKIKLYSVSAVILHAVVSGLHGLAHLAIPVPLSWFGYIYVGIVISLAPLVALLLIQQKSLSGGAILLFASMLGALLFGLYYHFILEGVDHVSHIPPGSWRIVFHVTAVLLVVTEAMGCWVGVWAWWVINRFVPVYGG